MQDGALMRHRQEPVNPVYGKLDRGLLRFRRFWDSRLLDRTLWAGDNIHSNGLRAGIRWEDRPVLDESPQVLDDGDHLQIGDLAT
jgi:hypothetical protein